MSLLLRLAGWSSSEGIASRLIDEFGSLPALFSAESDHLGRMVRDPDLSHFLAGVAETMRYCLAFEAERLPLIDNPPALIRYLRASMAFGRTELFRVLFLNSANGLLRDEVVSYGSVDGAPVVTRHIITRALDIGARYLILAHNHPSGSLRPSQEDLQTTREIVQAARHLDICVYDHVIVSAAGSCSLREQGLL